jgi:IS4 transposase
MVRASLERLLRPERLDQIFVDAARRQYTKQLLFSQLVALMAAVATRTHASIHSAYLAMKDRLGVSPAALYDKLNLLELGISQSLVRETAADASKVIDAMPTVGKEVLPGLEVFYLDGNHLASTEHRVAELRTTREGPLPGQSLAVLDAQRDLIVDWIPCEDGHTQERALLPELLERIRAGIVIVADRNFCTSKFFFGLATRGAYFVVRQHASTLTWKLRGKRRRAGRIDTGMVYEQGMELHFEGYTLSVRRVTLVLDHPTENGDTEIHIVTNLWAEQATAQQVAQAYGTRWTVEGAFQTLTDVLRCEVETLGYPRAALFSFATAVLVYNTYAVVQASLRAAHGAEVIKEKLSDYHLMSDVRRDGRRGP